MQRKPIPVDSFMTQAHSLWSKKWLVLCSGNFTNGTYNAMTVGWGSFGTMWGKPFAQVVVRPSRHTFQFMEKHDTFTLSVLPEELRPALQLLGSKSGRDGDKIAEAGLTPSSSTQVTAPSFKEAELIIECRKTYWDDFDPEKFIDTAIDAFYKESDYHRIYYGEVLAVSGTTVYCCD